MYFAELILPNGSVQSLHDPYTERAHLYSGVITEALGAIHDFRFSLLPNHPLFDAEIRPYSTRVQVRDGNDNIVFRGRVIDPSEKISTTGLVAKAYVAESELAYLLDSMQHAEEIHRIDLPEYFRRLLQAHNRLTAADGDQKRIDFIRIDGAPEYIPVEGPLNERCNCDRENIRVFYVNYASTLQNLREQVVDAEGGHLWLEYDADGRRVLHYTRQAGPQSSMPIALAENLESLRSDYYPSREMTQLIPLGPEIDCAERAIERLTTIGLLDSPNFWREEAERETMSRWTGQLLVNLSRLNFQNHCLCSGCCGGLGCDLCLNYIEFQRRRLQRAVPDVNCRYAFRAAVDFLAESGVINSADYWKHEDNAQHETLRWLVRLAAHTICTDLPRRVDSDCPLEAIDWLTNEIGFFNSPNFWREQVNEANTNRMSPWTAQLIVNLSRLNYRVRGEVAINAIRNSIDIDDMGLFNEAVDSLSNTGVINSPNYWKHPNRAEQIPLRWLIRLADAVIDHALPLWGNPNDAITRLQAIGFLENPNFWRAEADMNNPDRTMSPWIGRFLVNLSLLNFRENEIALFRTMLMPGDDHLPDIDDEGAYLRAVDSISNTGAIRSPEYWKDPERMRQVNLRWLIRLADLTVNHKNPQATFPRTRQTIERINGNRNWLPVGNSLDTVVQGVVIWDDAESASDLLAQANKWVAKHQHVTNSVAISAVDLSHLDSAYDNFVLGTKYGVDHTVFDKKSPHNEYRLIEKQINVIDPLKSSLTFGDKQVNLSTSPGTR